MGAKATKSILYSVPINAFDDKRGESPTYREPNHINGLISTITRWSNVINVQDLYIKIFQDFADRRCLASRELLPDGSYGGYVFKTFKEVWDRATRVAVAILNLDLAPLVTQDQGKDLRFLSIYSKNREEWVEVDIACALYGIITVPLYNTLGMDALKFAFDQTGTKTVFTETEHLDKFIKGARDRQFESLTHIVCFDQVERAHKMAAEQAGLKLLSWKEFLSYGKGVFVYPHILPENILTLCYTSGTTSLPKAAIITHGNMIAQVGAIEDFNGMDISVFTRDDIHLSYLPLANIVELVFINLVLARGASAGFLGGDPQQITEDLQALKPTVLISVPKMYNKFYDKIISTIDHLPKGFDKKIARYTIKSKLEKIKKGKYPHSSFDTKVFQAAKDILGGRIKCCISGSAPLSPEIADFLKVAFCCPLLEGYGLTESTSGVFVQKKEDPISGHVGGPSPCVEFKVIDVPEMGYTSRDRGPSGERVPRGEICLRGPCIFAGYYKDPEKTAEALDKYGWLHTGDIGQINPDGSLKIIDRKKNIFKLAKGQYLAPEKIENVYMACKYVSEIFVCGDPFKNYCVAIVVPEKEALKELASSLGVENIFGNICKDIRLLGEVLKEMDKVGRAGGLQEFELARNIYLEPVSFVAQKLCTPSLKLKRTEAKERYNEVIEKLYEGNDKSM